MSPGSLLRLSGFNSLLLSDGELLTVENATTATTVTALLNRNLTSKDLAKFSSDGNIDFSPQGLTMIELLQTALTPASGLGFIDEQNVRHRVRTSIRTEFSWMCLCSTSAVV